MMIGELRIQSIRHRLITTHLLLQLRNKNIRKQSQARKMNLLLSFPHLSIKVPLNHKNSMKATGWITVEMTKTK